MLYQLCLELKNFFETKKYIGHFSIVDNNIIGFYSLQENQYFRIVGSTFNDGVYQFTNTLELTDEQFDGAIWAMAVPKEVIALADLITDWQNKYRTADSENLSPYTSESFGGYSYSKNSGSDRKSGTWETVFASDLDRWRKICLY